MKNVKPISHSVKAKRHTPQYQMHKYFARRPYNVFLNLVNHYTNEKDIILDCFCGGGVTIYESVAQNRRAIGVDLNPLSTFITKMQIFDGDLSVTENLLDNFIKDIENKYSNVYKVKFNDDEGIIEWTEWAYTTKCPYCNNIILLSEDNKIRNGIYKCDNISCQGNIGVKRLDTIPYKATPLRVKYKSYRDNKIKIREIDEVIEMGDINEFINEDNTKINPDVTLPLNMDRQYEDRLSEKGILNYSDLFTRRNYYMNLFVFNEIMSFKNKMQQDLVDQLYFLFSSSLRYTNNMTRVTKNWEGGNPTSMDKHAFWLPNQFIENNVINILKKRKVSLLKGLEFSKKNLKNRVCRKLSFSDLSEGGDYLILNQSSSHLDIPDESIDCVITDPPYGSNVQYGELSIVWNVWYEKFKNKDSFLYTEEEAVMNRRLPEDQGKKGSDFYENMLFEVFSECYRVLKPEGYIVFTFNNKDLNVWLAMLRAVAKSGFSLPEQGIIFQDYIESYKNTSHLRYEGNLHGDFIYSFQKCKENQFRENNEHDIKTLLDNVIEKIAKDIIANDRKVLTTDLYQKILELSTRNMMEFIQTEMTKGNKIKEEFSKSHIDKVLSEYLIFEDGYWKRKN
ncbi:DNA methyltransferase [Streptococcus uberis]|uniref:DNA methyltransferase n=1 Tax=Streptococcus uberis TaxID=1349 RepID=UPI0019399F8C|nr:DNA methyltransferase [Streptococcus uberis]